MRVHFMKLLPVAVLAASLTVAAPLAAGTSVHVPIVCSRGPSGQQHVVTVSAPTTVAAGATYSVRIDHASSGQISHVGLNYIFEMFSQSRAVGEPSSGLGMGLHLARVFAQMHAGSITAKSPGKGQGSEFLIVVPLHHSGDDALLVEQAPTPQSEATSRRATRGRCNPSERNSLYPRQRK